MDKTIILSLLVSTKNIPMRFGIHAEILHHARGHSWYASPPPDILHAADLV